MQLVLMEIHNVYPKTEAYRYRISTKALCFRSRWDTCLYGRIYKEMQTAIGVAFVYTLLFSWKGLCHLMCGSNKSNGTGERIYWCVLYTDLLN